MPPSSHPIVSRPLQSGSMVKRKTPSELREELLKRASVVDLTDESPSPLAEPTKATDVDDGIKKPGLSKTPKYIDTRVDEVFAAKKPRFKIPSGKENAKENTSLEKTTNLKNLSVFSTLEAKKRQGFSCLENSVASSEVSKDDELQSCQSQTNKKCSQRNFLTVAQLSSASDKSSGLAAAIDMGKAIRGLAAVEQGDGSGVAADLTEGHTDLTTTIAGNFLSECHVPGHKVPLDLTLKTSMRIVFSSSVNWSVMRGSMPQLTLQQCSFKSKYMRISEGFKVLHSSMYPQSVLPPSLISVLNSSTADEELEFLRKRHVAWRESFKDLYYMLRKNICGLFYVCTSQFVVMFTSGNGSGRSKCLCNAYISQSTQGLRSLLREHGICFSMPLCHSKMEQVATEDLVELSEIEKQNLGQTRLLTSFSDVDNTPESLLAFSGHFNVQALYELLLNYRSVLTSLSGVDVPVLCSPVPFQHSVLSSPDIKCMETRRAEDIVASYNGSTWKDGEPAQGSSDGLCTIDIKDTVLPPWIICRICALMTSEGKSFEGRFVTGPSSIGLNVALKSTSEKGKPKAAIGESSQDCSDAFGIPEAVVMSQLWSCSLKGVKYCDDSYTISLSPV